MAFCPKLQKSGLHCLEKKRRQRQDPCGAWRKRGKGLRFSPAPEHTWSFPAISHILPSVFSARSSSPSAPSYPPQPKPCPPLPKDVLSQSPDNTTCPLHPQGSSPRPDFADSVLSPQLVSKSPGSRDHVSCLSESLDRTQQQGCTHTTLTSHSPHSPLELSAHSDLSKFFSPVAPLCICTCSSTPINMLSSPCSKSSPFLKA